MKIKRLKSKKILTLPIVILISILIFSFFISQVLAKSAGQRRALLDVNRDGSINKTDLEIVRSLLGQKNPSGIPALADVNQNSIINGLDFVLVSGKIGQVVSGCEKADLNNNKTVDLADFEILKSYFAQIDSSVNMAADLNGDGYITIIDFSILRSVFDCNL